MPQGQLLFGADNGVLCLTPKAIRQRQKALPPLLLTGLTVDLRPVAYQSDAPYLYANIDPTHFEKVVTNILSNAFKFTPDGGAITLTLTESDGQALIAIHNTGSHIAPSDLRRVFERFYQAAEGRPQSPSLLVRRHRVPPRLPPTPCC